MEKIIDTGEIRGESSRDVARGGGQYQAWRAAEYYVKKEEGMEKRINTGEIRREGSRDVVREGRLVDSTSTRGGEKLSDGRCIPSGTRKKEQEGTHKLKGKQKKNERREGRGRW
jgi:hypothetical protein